MLCLFTECLVFFHQMSNWLFGHYKALATLHGEILHTHTHTHREHAQLNTTILSVKKTIKTPTTKASKNMVHAIM